MTLLSASDEHSWLESLGPTGDAGEAWMIVFRVIQGAGAGIMFPAALESPGPPEPSASAASGS
jgi:hypothetical protein